MKYTILQIIDTIQGKYHAKIFKKNVSHRFGEIQLWKISTRANVKKNLNFGDIMVLVWTPPHPHPKACVSRNCDTNARIKFIYDTAIDDLEWKNPSDFGENWKTKMTINGHFVKIWWKSLCTP